MKIDQQSRNKPNNGNNNLLLGLTYNNKNHTTPLIFHSSTLHSLTIINHITLRKYLHQLKYNNVVNKSYIRSNNKPK